MLVGEVMIMYQTLENTHSGAAAVPSHRRTIATPILNMPSAGSRADVTGLHTGLHLRRRFNTVRYVLLGTGPFAPPVGKFNV